MAYAQALLSKAQAEGDPFGGAAPVKKADENSAPADGGGEDDDGDEDGEQGEGEGEEAESDDLELSFQCFEVARIIYEKAGPAQELPLAHVLESLGEVAMENEMWEDAIAELERSVLIKKRLLPASDRQLAHLHYQIATATVARSEKARHDLAEPPPPEGEPQGSDAPPAMTPEACAAIVEKCRTQAVAHYQQAADTLQLRLDALNAEAASHAEAKVAGGPDPEGGEVAELAELLAEVKAKVEEQQAAPITSTAIANATAHAQQPAAASESAAGVTTIGFGMPPPSAKAGVTTIGFGAPPTSAADASEHGVTTIGFGAPAESSSGFAAPSVTTLPVRNLGVVGGRGAKRVRTDAED